MMRDNEHLWADITLAGLAPGLAGAGLTLAGVQTPVTGVLTLLFVLLAPALAVWFLLPSTEPLVRVTVAVTSAIVLSSLVAQVMLTTSSWSPRGGVIAIGTVSALLVTARVAGGRLAGRARR